MPQVDEKLNELHSTFKGLVYKPSISKARKRKQLKQKERYIIWNESYIKPEWKIQKQDSVMQKVFLRVNLDSMDVTVGKEDINNFKCNISKFIKERGEASFAWNSLKLL